MYHSHVKPPKTVFVCQECGGQQPKWVGRCPDCGAWNSLVEEQPAPQTAPAAASHRYGLVSGAHPPSSTATYRPPTRRGFPLASTSSIESWVEASFPARSCCLAASRASENPRCCCRWPRTWRAALVRFSTARARSPSTKSSCAASGCRSTVAPVPACRDVPRANPRRDRAAQARARHRRFDSDDLLGALSIRARQHRPGARGRDAPAVRRQGPQRSDRARRPRHEGRQSRRSRRRWSTSSTPSCISKESGIMRIASCAPSRTGSARRASSASSR